MNSTIPWIHSRHLVAARHFVRAALAFALAVALYFAAAGLAAYGDARYLATHGKLHPWLNVIYAPLLLQADRGAMGYPIRGYLRFCVGLAPAARPVPATPAAIPAWKVRAMAPHPPPAPEDPATAPMDFP
jgi:hypothetical protein